MRTVSSPQLASKVRRSDCYRPHLLRLEDRTLPGDTVLGVLAAQAGLARPPESAPASAVAPLATMHTSAGPGRVVIGAADHFPGETAVVATAWTGLTTTDEYVWKTDALEPNFLASAATNARARQQLPTLDGGEGRDTPAPEPTMIPPPAAPAAPGVAVAWWGTASSHGTLEQVVAATPLAPPVSRGETPGVTSHDPWCGNPAPPPRTDEWGTYQHDASHTGRTRAAIDPASLRPAWEAPAYTFPIIVGSNLLAWRLGGEATLTSFQLSGGAPNWSYTNRFDVMSPATHAEGLVVFAAREAGDRQLRLHVHDVSDGSLEYRVILEGSQDSPLVPTIHRNPVTGNLTAYVATHNSLWAVRLDATSGSVLWQAGGSFGGQSIPTIVGGSVVLAGPGQYYAFDQTTGAPNHFHQGNTSGGGGTTVAYDADRKLFYVLETYSTSAPEVLTAYAYKNNSNIRRLWQRTGPGIRNGGSVAIGPDSRVYVVDTTTLLELDPYTGRTVRSRAGLSIATAVTPAISAGHLWLYSENFTLIYDLNTLNLVTTLPGSRGSLNSAYDSPGALADGVFALDPGHSGRPFRIFTHALYQQDNWATYQHDAYHTGCSGAWTDPAALNLAWRAPQGYAIPIIAGDSVYAMRNQQGISTDMTSVSSFNLHTGAINWTYTNRFVFPGHPTYAEGLLVFAANSDLYVLDAATGSLRYTVRINSGGQLPTIHTNPSTGNLTAYVAAHDRLTAINLGATSGTILWTGTGDFGGFSIPTIVGDSVVVAGPGQYYAFDQATGARNHFHQGNVFGGGGTTVAYDATWRLLYVLESYTTQVSALTAYYYHDHATIVQLWQRTGPGIRTGGSVAIGPDSKVYAVDNTNLVELDPYGGSTVRSVSGQTFANAVTPAIAGDYLWAYSDGQTHIYDLSTLTRVRSLPGSRGSLNSAFDGPGAITDGYFALDYGNIYGDPGFDVYRSF